MMLDSYEIITDGRTVWINAVDSNIGRFSRFGIDVHTTAMAQMAGASECLACTHERPRLADWQRFQDLMWQHYQVKITDRQMPEFIRAEVT